MLDTPSIKQNVGHQEKASVTSIEGHKCSILCVYLLCWKLGSLYLWPPCLFSFSSFYIASKWQLEAYVRDPHVIQKNILYFTLCYPHRGMYIHIYIFWHVFWHSRTSIIIASSPSLYIIPDRVTLASWWKLCAIPDCHRSKLADFLLSDLWAPLTARENAR